MKTDSIKVSAVIPAEPEAVYKAWMSSKGWIDFYFTPMKEYFSKGG